MKKFTLFLVAIFAMVNVANAQRAWAYDLELTPTSESYTFSFKAVTAGDATLVFYKEGVEAGTLNLGSVSAGDNTVTKTSEELLAAIQQSGDFTWGVKMTGEAIAAGSTLKELNSTLYYNMMGIVADVNPESDYFGKVYMQMSYDGKPTYGTTKQTQGFFIYDPIFNLISTPNVGIKPTLPTDYTFDGTNRLQFHRVAIDPKTGNLAFCYSIANKPGVFSIGRNNLTGEVTNLLAGVTGIENIKRTNALCFDEDGALYIIADVTTLSTTGNIYKIVDGVATKLSLKTPSGKSIWIDEQVGLVSDGRGGLWVAQNRSGITDNSAVFHVNVAKDTVDFVLEKGKTYSDWFTGGNGNNCRGGIAYNVKENVLATHSEDAKVSLFKVTYDEETGVPTITKWIQGATGGKNTDAIAFDYAGDLYTGNSSGEYFRKYEVPTDNNTCTTPAKKAQVITLVATTPEYSVTISVNGNGTVTGANTGTYLEGTELTLTATPAEHYEFTGWTGDVESTDNPLTITVDGDKNITANFAKKQYTLTVQANDAAKGDVTGSGTYEYGTEVQITATPKAGYEFIGWSNGSKENPLTISMEEDTELTANFRAILASSITLNAHPVKDYSASIVGTMKRAIQNGENTIVLTHEADGTPHIYNIAHATKTVTEISQEGVVAIDPDNAGDFLAISDIALTADGKLVACNYMLCQNTASYVDAGYKRGTTRFYIWDEIDGDPTLWFTSQQSVNYYRAKVGYTMALKGTSDDAWVIVAGFNNNATGPARFDHYHLVNGSKSTTSPSKAVNMSYSAIGSTYEISASPLADGNWVLDGELAVPTEFVESKDNQEMTIFTPIAEGVLGKKYNGATYLANYNDHHLMIAPYADGDEKLAGVKVLGVSDGFAAATLVTTNADLANAIDATTAAATAYVDGDGDLTIYLIADAKVYTFSEKVPAIVTYNVTATAGEGGTVEGSGPYEEGTTATLIATADAHYDFVNWTEDGEVVSTTAEYSFIVTKDIELTANFQEHAKYTITASAADNTMGYVTGAGTYYIGETVTLKATAKTGYYFTGWSDSNTDNPRTFTATENVTLQANFATAYPRVYAYDLDVADNGDSYTFSFKPNTNAVSGNLLLYNEDGTAVVQTHVISTAIVAHTATSITLNKTELPNQADIPWAIQLSGNAIPAFAETFADADYRFAKGHATVDNSPESEYFGRVYVADRRSTKKNSGVYVYNADLTPLNTEAYKLGLSTAGYSRPAVGADGTVYLTGYTDDESGIFVVDPADLTKCTQFYNGTRASSGLFTNGGVEIGSSTSGVSVYGEGKNAVLYSMMEDGTDADANSGKQPIVKYQIGQEDGTVLKQWSTAPTWHINYPATGKDSYNFGNNAFAATEKGVWISQNKANDADRPEIAFIDKDGVIQFMQNLNKSQGAGLAVNADNTVLYLQKASEILEYNISWAGNKPALTLANTYPVSLPYITTLSLDYAGNLIACAGTQYGSNTDNNVMKLVAYTLPTDNNTCTVPAAKAKALKLGVRYNVEVTVNDPAMGTVTGAGEYKENETATLTATPAEHHRFVNWTKSAEIVSTEATYSFAVTENITLTATFEAIPQYTISVSANDGEMGSVTGGGTYYEGATATLTATAKGGYVFEKWSDDNTDNPRTITVGEAAAYTAIFKVAVPRAWAYDLRLDADTDPDNYIFTFKTTSAGTATLIFKDKDGNIQNFGTHTATANAAEEKTITIAKSTFDAATKDIYWEVKLAGEAIAKMAEITDPTEGIYNFYVPQGVAVDNSPNSMYFGRIYVAEGTTGGNDGLTEMAKQMTAGLFVYNQALEKVQPATGYTGIIPQNVTFNTNKPTSTDEINIIRQQMHRVAVDPVTGEVAFAYYKSPATAIYSMNPDDLAGNAQNLIEGSSITYANSLCFDSEGTLYVMNNANTGLTGGQIYKVQDDEVTLFAAHDKNNQWAVYDNAMASDGRGGLWIAQNRYEYDYPILSHVSKDGVVDFAVTENLNDWFPNNNTGSSYRGQLAYNEQEDILAFAGNKMVTLFTVEYDGNGKPTINKLMSTPLLGGGNIDGVAFDYAGDLYVASASAERLYKFVVPTTDNTCTVPAPESQIIMKEARYTVTVVANPEEMGTVSGGGTEFLAGDIATLTATANDGYRFVNWTYGTTTSTDNPLELTVEGNITVTAHFEAKPLAIEGTVKRAVQIGESTVVLTHEANGNPHLYKVVDGTLVAEISQEGVVAADAGYLSISDIAATEDGKLVACNYVKCTFDPVSGTSYFYKWNDITGSPNIWFTSQTTGNYATANMGYSMAVKGTSSDAQVTITAFNVNAGTNDVRFTHHTIVDGKYQYSLGVDSKTNCATVGSTYELNASPLASANWIFDGENITPTEFVNNGVDRATVTINASLDETLLGKKFNGATYLTVLGRHLMVAPYADGENVAGVTVLDITNGLDQAEEMDYAELTSSLTANAAATAVKVNGDDLTITLVVDNQVYMFNIDLNMQYTRNVTNGNFGTICLPYASASTNGAEFYEVAGRETDKVLLDQVTKLEAGRPYIFRATAGKLVVIYEGEEALSPGNYNGLYGTFIDNTPVTSGNYIVYQNELRLCGDGCYINANRAYLILDDVSAPQPVQAGRRRISMSLQGENQTTALDNITEEGTLPAEQATKIIHNGQLIIIRDGVMYNAQGQKL